MKNVLITGGAGFIGSNICCYLIKEKDKDPDSFHKIVCMDYLGSMANKNNLKEVLNHPSFKFVQGDITQPDLVKFVLERYNIDTIIHAAGETRWREETTYAYTFNNVIATHVLLEVAKSVGSVTLFLHLSSDEVYGKLSSPAEKSNVAGEDTVLEPSNPYGATKAAAELICKAYFTSFKFPVIILRFSTTFGQFQNPSMIVPIFWYRLKNNLPCQIHGDGTRVRRMLHINDVLNAIHIILIKGSIGSVYNATCEKPISLKDIALSIAQVMGIDKPKDLIMEFIADRPYADERYIMDSSKLTELGWKPEIDWKEGLLKTINWFENNINNWDKSEFLPPSSSSSGRKSLDNIEKVNFMKRSSRRSSKPMIDVGLDYVPKNILITGGMGFIGSHFVNLLVKKYPHYNIVNVDKLDYCANMKNSLEIDDFSNYHFVHGDILNKDLISLLLREYHIETIVHFAAQTHVDSSFCNSLSFTENNILGTHVLLEACHEYGCIKRFVHISTDEVYGEQTDDDGEVIETNVLDPMNPYSATKAAAEFLVKSYAKAYNLPIIITRGNNVYGSMQYPEKLIPKFINQLLRGSKCTIHGEGKNQRNFIHVKDAAIAFETILHKGHNENVYNMSGSKDRTVLEVAKELVSILQPEGDFFDWIMYVPDRLHNDMRYAISGDKLKALGWIETVGWNEGINETIQWYKEHQNYWNNIDSALSPDPFIGIGTLPKLKF